MPEILVWFNKSSALIAHQSWPCCNPVCDRIGNSGRNRNRNRIAMIWPEPEPEPEPDCHPKKVAGFDRIGRI